jgi:hypothetical protein
VPSLQGSLGTVSLPEVLGLLVATAATGEMLVTGNRTGALARVPSVQGRLWLGDGRLAAADVAGERDLVEALVELLWLVEGTFTFEPGQPRIGAARAEVADVLADALARHAEWREIELVVPSQRAWLELNPDPPPRRVVLQPEQWRLVAAVGGGGSVGAVVDRLGGGDLAGCRAVKEIIEAGLVTVHPSRPAQSEGAAPPAEPSGGRERAAPVAADRVRGRPLIAVPDRDSS